MIPWRRSFFVAFLLAGLSWSSAKACHLIFVEKAPTLTQDFQKRSMVLVGVIANADKEKESTEFVIDQVLKSNEYLGSQKVKTIDGKQVLTLPRYLPDAKNKKYIVFLDIDRGKIDPIRGVELKDGSELIAYLKGAVALKDRDDQLRYFFKHLNSPDSELASDAYKEFAQSDYRDYMAMAKKLPPDLLANWLQDAKKKTEYRELFATLLGLCGKREHAQLLGKMLSNAEMFKGTNGVLFEGILVGYVSLEPNDGWKYITGLFKNKNRDFAMRYAGVRTARFLWEKRPDLVAQKDLVEGIALLLDDGEVADFAIEDFRKWKRWETTDRVLAQFGKETHNVPIVKRAILRFALQSPTPRASAFIQEQRRRDPNLIKDIEELLKQESPEK